MTDVIHGILLGLVEGLTEFLPVSSTGHLILAGHLLGFDGDRAKTFDVFIQLGAILAVVVYYRTRFLGLLKPATGPGFSGGRGLVFLGLTTLPAVLFGLLAHDLIKAHLFQPSTVAIGLALGAAWILWAEHAYKQTNPSDLAAMSWRLALGIGLFQCIAMWPGMSRSASTILGGMILGLNRKSATEYSFFAAVPVMVAACGYDLLKNLNILSAADIPLFAVGFIVSFASAWYAIRFLIRFVSRHSLGVFAWYRLGVAGLVFLLMRGG